MPKYNRTNKPSHFCDYCDVYLTHDSRSVRKAHDAGRNHIRNVVDYYQRELLSGTLNHTLLSIGIDPQYVLEAVTEALLQQQQQQNRWYKSYQKSNRDQRRWAPYKSNSNRNRNRSYINNGTEIGRERAQSVIDSVMSDYQNQGVQPDANPYAPTRGPMSATMPGQPFAPPPFGFPPPGAIPTTNTAGPGMPFPPVGRGMAPPMPNGMPFPPPPGGLPGLPPPPGGMPGFPPPNFGQAGSPPAGMPFPPPGSGANSAAPAGMPFSPPPGAAAPPAAGPPGLGGDHRRPPGM